MAKTEEAVDNCNGTVVGIIEALQKAFSSVYETNAFLGSFLLVAVFGVIFYFLYCMNANKKAFTTWVGGLTARSSK